MRRLLALSTVLVLLAACGGGSSGGGSTAPPAFTDLAGSRWSVTDTVSGSNSCGVAPGTSDSYVVHVIAQNGSSLTLYDERSGAANAVTATLSGHTLTFAGERYPVMGCSNMTGSYTATLDETGQNFSGNASVSCADNNCTASASVSGHRI